MCVTEKMFFLLTFSVLPVKQMINRNKNEIQLITFKNTDRCILVCVSVELWSFVPFGCIPAPGCRRVPADSLGSKVSCLWLKQASAAPLGWKKELH